MGERQESGPVREALSEDAAAHIDNRLEFAMEELDRECRSAHARGEDGKRVGIEVLRKHFGAALLIVQAEFAPLTNSALRAKLAALKGQSE